MARQFSSQTSMDSIGMGIGATEPIFRAPTDDFRSNLMAVGKDQFKSTFNVMQYLFICEEHKRMAISPPSSTGGVIWIPYTNLSPEHTWEQAAENGLKNFFGKRPEVDTVEGQRHHEKCENIIMPELKMNIIDVLRVQLPSEKFEVRLTHCVRLSKTNGFNCCQNTANLHWIETAVVLKDETYASFWGPEIKMYIDQLVKPRPEYIFEFSLENAMSYFNREDRKKSVYGKLLKDSKINRETVMALYEDYLVHCSPAFFMSIESFGRYLGRYGYNRRNPKFPALFRAACFNKKDYMDWFEFQFAIICMDPTTKPHEARHRMMFRYIDQKNTGLLTKEDLKKMSRDIGITEKSLNKLDPWCRFHENGKLTIDNFARWMRDKKPPEFDSMCRSPKPILAPLVEAAQKRARDIAQKNASLNGQCRPNRGTCDRCRAQNFNYCLHCVLIDANGRCTEPTRTANKADVCFNMNESVNLERYSAEYRFGDGCVSGIFLEQIRETRVLFQEKDDPKMCFDYLTYLFEGVKDVFGAESRLMKINAPVAVIGDILGNLDTALIIQNVLCPTAPVINTNLIFLGNYIDKEANTSLEVLCFLYALKLQAPDKILLLRGAKESNNEASIILKDRCQDLFGQEDGLALWSSIADTLSKMPFAVLIDDMIFCVHSSVPTINPVLTNLLDIPPHLPNIEECPAAYELINKIPTAGIASNQQFSRADCRTFMQVNDITNVIRGNGNPKASGGFELHFGGECLSIYSSTTMPTVCYLDPGKKLFCKEVADVPPTIQFIRLNPKNFKRDVFKTEPSR